MALICTLSVVCYNVWFAQYNVLSVAHSDMCHAHYFLHGSSNCRGLSAFTCSPMHQRAYKNGSLIGQRISLVYATLHTTYGAGACSLLSLWGSILYAVPTLHQCQAVSNFGLVPSPITFTPRAEPFLTHALSDPFHLGNHWRSYPA